MTTSQPPYEGSDTQKLNLSDQDWDRYVQRIREAVPHDLASSDKRSEQRYKKFVQCIVRIEAEPKPQIYLIHSRDISSEGMGFLHSEFLTEGTQCVVVLETNVGAGEVVGAKVVWTREIGGGVYAVGLQFEEVIDLTNLIDIDREGESTAA